MGYRIFTVEITSEGEAPDHHSVVPASGDPLDAVIEALRFHTHSPASRLFEKYDERNDPNDCYRGWSRIVISLDGSFVNGKWVGEDEPPPTSLEQLAETGSEVSDG